ncbi:hypothetical protein SAMN05216281_1554, partial [Cryobacterium luteum]
NTRRHHTHSSHATTTVRARNTHRCDDRLNPPCNRPSGRGNGADASGRVLRRRGRDDHRRARQIEAISSGNCGVYHRERRRCWQALMEFRSSHWGFPYGPSLGRPAGGKFIQRGGRRTSPAGGPGVGTSFSAYRLEPPPPRHRHARPPAAKPASGQAERPEQPGLRGNHTDHGRQQTLQAEEGNGLTTRGSEPGHLVQKRCQPDDLVHGTLPVMSWPETLSWQPPPDGRRPTGCVVTSVSRSSRIISAHTRQTRRWSAQGVRRRLRASRP